MKKLGLPRALFLATLIGIVASTISRAQISTPCTSSMITSFTPCFNFITGSSANGNSPTQDCCESFRSLVRTSVECACLVTTANVPIPIPINRTFSISLPRACNTGGVPLQCKASGSPLPPAGPALFVPPPPPPLFSAPPPHKAADSPDIGPSPFSPQSSKAAKESTAPPAPAPAPESAFSTDSGNPTDTSPADAPAEPNTGTVPRTPVGIRPVMNPFASNSDPTLITSSLPSLLLILVGVVTVNKLY